MPYGDGTGPYGTGPVGMGMGPCGRGRRGRFGFGMGFGFGAARPYGYPVQLTKEEQKKILEQRLKDLEIAKENIEKRLQELNEE